MEIFSGYSVSSFECKIWMERKLLEAFYCAKDDILKKFLVFTFFPRWKLSFSHHRYMNIITSWFFHPQEKLLKFAIIRGSEEIHQQFITPRDIRMMRLCRLTIFRFLNQQFSQNLKFVFIFTEIIFDIATHSLTRRRFRIRVCPPPSKWNLTLHKKFFGCICDTCEFSHCFQFQVCEEN